MTFVINKDATLPAYQRTLLDEDGNAVNLSTASSVTVQFKRVGSSTVVTRTGSFVDKPNGVVKYQWISADTATSGDYEAVWFVDGTPYPSGSFELVTVYEDDEIDPDDLIFCTVAEARALLRLDLDVDELAFAQTTIAIRCGLDVEDLDTYDALDDQDRAGLKQATAFQARWLRSQFDFMDRMNLADENADGESRTYRGNALMLAPWAEWALSNTRFSATIGTTIDTPRAGIEDTYELLPGFVDERTWRPW